MKILIKGLTGNIEVLKLVKMISHSDIKNIDKESDERYQIDKDDQLEKNGCKWIRMINWQKQSFEIVKNYSPDKY